MPSFGEWGYVLVAHEGVLPRRPLVAGLRFLSEETHASLFQFPRTWARCPRR
nr:hypothetical protein [Cystobacter fuscus]